MDPNYKSDKIVIEQKDIDEILAFCQQIKDEPQLGSTPIKVSRSNPLYDFSMELGKIKSEINGLRTKESEQANELNKSNIQLETISRQLKESIDESIQLNEELSCSNELLYQKNEMLEETREELLKLNLNLESLVDKRTKKLNNTINKLNKTVKELDRFVYSASHELSAPLKSMLGLIHISKKEYDHSKIREYLYYMEKTLYRLDDVTKHLMSFSKNNNLKLKKESFNLPDLVQSIIAELNPDPLKRSINFKIDIKSTQELYSDRYRIQTILHDLIDNSIKYRNENNTIQNIEIGFAQNGKINTLYVKDDGIGIRKQELPHVFQMYYRGTEVSNGSGLGLFIVKEIADQLNGEIAIKSKPGIGTEIFIRLPQE
ncbi:MAG: HAMP domain-containing histidine kinase [Cytophagales bacterium]|nr:HAMP domain-containing histidine kinase [Cytophagales bacterium]